MMFQPDMLYHVDVSLFVL